MSDEISHHERDLLDALQRGGARIEITVERRRYGKAVTVLTGFPDTTDLAALAKRLKQRLATGGTSTRDSIELQGDHHAKVAGVLSDLGFPTADDRVPSA